MKNLTPMALLLALTGGCATVAPPQELVVARNTYQGAASGPAAQLDPTALHTAQVSLDTAERSFSADGDTPTTRDLAYVAERRAPRSRWPARSPTSRCSSATSSSRR